jgi:hypothetical protein
MTNQTAITLAMVPNIPIGKLAVLSQGQLLSLQTQASEQVLKAQMLKEWLDSTIALKHRKYSRLPIKEAQYDELIEKIRTDAKSILEHLTHL